MVALKRPPVHSVLVSPTSQNAQSFRAGHEKVRFYEKKNKHINFPIAYKVKNKSFHSNAKKK